MSMQPNIDHRKRGRPCVSVAFSAASPPSLWETVRRAPLSAALFVVAYVMILTVTVYPGLILSAAN